MGATVAWSRRRTARHLAPFVALTVPLLLAATASPAAAHGSPGNYVTVITSVQPEMPGLVVAAEPDGSYLTIDNRTGRTLIVIGYEHEAYLKITAHGVWKNTRSPTTVVNEGGDESHLPEGVTADATPAWVEVSPANTYRYHDHRIDWMGDGRPAAVAASVNRPHLIKSWAIELLVDGTPVTINGTLRWAPTGFGRLDALFVVLCVTLTIGLLVAVVVDERRKPALAA